MEHGSTWSGKAERSEAMKKRHVISAAAVLLACSCASSLSYMNDSARAVNEFTFVGENGLAAILTEPEWNPQRGLLIVPNTVIPKDPQVTNISEADLDELVALRLEFIYTDTCPEVRKRGMVLEKQDMEYVSEVFQIDYNSDSEGDWVRFDGEDGTEPVQHFYYSHILKRNLPARGDTTIPLFTRLTVDPSVDNEQFSHIQKIGGFDIRISGHVLQHMQGEVQFGLDSGKSAYESGLFTFDLDGSNDAENAKEEKKDIRGLTTENVR